MHLEPAHSAGNQLIRKGAYIRLLGWLRRLRRRQHLVLAYVQTVLLGTADYVTGHELAFSIFYLLPIALVAWFVTRRSAMLLSVFCALTWYLADLFSGQTYSSAALPVWNFSTRLLFFFLVSFGLAALRASNNRYDELMHFIVHDLRSPLTNVMMGLQELRSLKDLSDRATLDFMLDICRHSCQRMAVLINSLLDLRRLSEGELPVEKAEISTHQLVDLALDEVRLWAEGAGIKLDTHLDPQVKTVHADTAMTTGVLVNLLGNAIKFSPSGGTVVVRVEPLPPNWIAFSIEDEGPGIPVDWRDRVFDKFTQLSREDRVKGAGLGLAYCRLVVHAQGGEIWVEGGAKGGTRVKFTLPVDG